MLGSVATTGTRVKKKVTRFDARRRESTRRVLGSGLWAGTEVEGKRGDDESVGICRAVWELFVGACL